MSARGIDVHKQAEARRIEWVGEAQAVGKEGLVSDPLFDLRWARQQKLC